MNFENEYLIKLSKYVKDKCSNNCGFEKIEENFLMNFDKHIDKNEVKSYKENFDCFEKCNAKYFESGIISLQTLGNFISNNDKK